MQYRTRRLLHPQAEDRARIARYLGTERRQTAGSRQETGAGKCRADQFSMLVLRSLAGTDAGNLAGVTESHHLLR